MRTNECVGPVYDNTGAGGSAPSGGAGLAVKAPCRAGTTVAGGNITLVGGAPSTLDTVALVLNDRILVKNQTAPAENGIYTVSVVGGGANGTWVRATDMDATGEVTGMTMVAVSEGTAYVPGNADTLWFVTSSAPITIGVTAMVWANVSTIQGPAITALFPLTPAADQVPYFTGATTAALASFVASARTFLATFPTPTFAANVAMAGFQITGLGGPATVPGVALRYESQGPGTFPTIAAFPTQILATNVTRTVWADGERGVTLVFTSATATPRLSGQVGPGTSIATQHTGFSTNATGTFSDGGIGVILARPLTDGKLASLFAYRASASAVLFLVGQWTDKDTYNVTRGNAQLGEAYGDMSLRLRASGGNIIAEYSVDGGNWTNILTVAEATFFAGVAGTPTQAGLGSMNTQSGVSSGLYSRATIT